jgi:serine-type D-Ala-D-Ala carboxypeptidase/endopeptidase (penicillin-binding protein 4)
MKSFFTRLLLLVLCGFATLNAFAQTLPSAVQKALIAQQIPASAASIVLQEVGARNTLVAHNAQTPVNPASLMKLITTFSALELLGAPFQWRTSLFANGTIQNGVLDGSLYIQGSGDPKLVVENLWMLLRRVQAAGVREIRGDIVLDRSAFDIAELNPGAFDNDSARAYNVGADALLMNYKALSYRFVPNGYGVVMSVEPRLSGMSTPSTVRMSAGDCGDWKSKLGADFTDPLAPRFAGSYAESCGEQVWNLGALTPQRYAQALITQLWADLGGKLKGTVTEGRVIPTARLLAEWTSPPLAEVIRDINKYSNNVMARQLFLTIANQTTGQPATTAAAERAIKQWAQQRGLAMPELVMENGSGLSRNERISAASLARLLQAAYASPVMAELMSSLPITGQDGTMKRRKDHIAAGSAHMKTGSLRDVRAMAGYVDAANGKRYVLVAVITHPNTSGAALVLDAILSHAYTLTNMRVDNILQPGAE